MPDSKWWPVVPKDDAIRQYAIGACFGASLGVTTWLAAVYGADAVNGFAALIAAGAAVSIPIVLARSAEKQAAAAQDRASQLDQVAAMHEMIGQWQNYNLAVATGQVKRSDIVDKQFAELSDAEMRQIHLIFFKVTALDQLHFAMKNNSIHPEWADQMLCDIGKIAAEDERLFNIALDERGYTDDFKEALLSACERVAARKAADSTILGAA